MRWYSTGATLVWLASRATQTGPLILKAQDGTVQTLAEDANRRLAEHVARDLEFKRIGIADDLATAAGELVTRAESTFWDAADVLDWQERCGWATPEAITAHRNAEEILAVARRLEEMTLRHAREVTEVPSEQPPDDPVESGGAHPAQPRKRFLRPTDGS